MTNPILAPELLELIDNGDHAKLREVVDTVHPAETADSVAALDDTDVRRFLSIVRQQQAAEIFSHFGLERQVELAGGALMSSDYATSTTCWPTPAAIRAASRPRWSFGPWRWRRFDPRTCCA